MKPLVAPETATAARMAELFKEQLQSIVRHTDRLFAWLMISQWLFGIGLALVLSPFTWTGMERHIHPHVWLAIVLGGLITSAPVILAFARPGKMLTRHVIAVGQMLMSALLIHLTGGRMETHFHVFGSLAILAFYRDWRVLVSATIVVFADHLTRGTFWPESVYGVAYAPVWRSLEHAAWVLFEDLFLVLSIRKSISEMELVAERQARLEAVKANVEQMVADRTVELTRENAERRFAEARLRRSQSQLAQAQQLARIGSWEWDMTRNEVVFSEETRALYGFGPGDGFNMEKCMERVHPDDQDKVKAALAAAITDHTPYECEHRAQLPDGTIHVIMGRGEIFTDVQGNVVKIFGIVQDITEAKRSAEALRRSEEQLRQSQKMEAVGRLAGGVAHDFNNLLTVIRGYCEMALLMRKEVEPLREHITEIQEATERAAALTRQLLAFSRKQVLQLQVMRLDDTVRGMEKMLRRLIGEDVTLGLTFDPHLGNVKADPGQIEQVIMNLAVNARDAMPRGGKLSISVTNVTIDQPAKTHNRVLSRGEYVMLSVSDTGMGMTPDVMAHMFEPFFTTKEVGKGTGLGLATCHGIVTQSGGEILVYSEPNCGTTFKIFLPRIDFAQKQSAVRSADAPPAGTESILVVEDEPAVRKLACVVLQKCGYQVQECSNAFEALRLIKRDPRLDLVLTDVIMPQMSGKQLHDEIKGQLPHIKVLLMSGYTDDALANHGVLEEGVSFLEKPFSPARLAKKVREVLDTPGKAPVAVGKNGRLTFVN